MDLHEWNKDRNYRKRLDLTTVIKLSVREALLKEKNRYKVTVKNWHLSVFGYKIAYNTSINAGWTVDTRPRSCW